MGLSGKCDFQDTCEIFGAQTILEKYKVYAAGNGIVPLAMNSEKDLVAYYPYLVAVMVSDKGRGGEIHLSRQSFIDAEEREWLEWRLKCGIRYWKRCKRKQERFDEKECLEQIIFFSETETDKKIVERIKTDGDKATVNGLHDATHDRMRAEWLKLMVDAGWDEMEAKHWIYGNWRVNLRGMEDGC